MKSLEKAILRLNASAAADSADQVIDVRVRLLTTLIFIGVVLSVPIDNPGALIWYFAFPIVSAECSGIGYGRILCQSCIVLPLVALVGAFNPLLDRQAAFSIGSVTVSHGWVTFMSLLLRGLLAFQALAVLVRSAGFLGFCSALRKLGAPNVLVTQLYMLYRYATVLLEETLSMHRARQARGFGRRSYPLSMWGVFVGQLLLRSVARATRIHRAMVARGFNGHIDYAPVQHHTTRRSVLYLLLWSGLFVTLRFVDLNGLMGRWITN